MGKIDTQTVIDFVIKNYNSYKAVSNTNIISIINENPELLMQATEVIKQEHVAIEKFIREKQMELMNCRLPIDIVAEQIIKIITTKSTLYIVNSKPIYVGCAVNTEDKQHLTELCKQLANVSDANGKMYIHHMTQQYFGAKITQPKTIIEPGSIYQVTIDALIVRKIDNACAYRICRDKSPIFESMHSIPHITVWMPRGIEPVESNKFINLADDTVTIYQLDYSINLVGFWF